MMNNVIRKTLLTSVFTGYAMLTGLSAMAADTEIFFRPPPANAPKPNLLFIMSTGGTMNGGVTPPDGCADSSKIGALKCILKDIALTEDRINLGLMRFSGPGGPVLYPLVNLSDAASAAPITATFDTDEHTPGNHDVVQLVERDGSGAVIAVNHVVSEPTLLLGGDDQLVGLHFPIVNVPQGATITAARVIFTVSDTVGGLERTASETDLATFDIYVEDTVTGGTSLSGFPYDTDTNSNEFISGSTPENFYDTRNPGSSITWNSVASWEYNAIDPTSVHAVHSTPDLSSPIEDIIQATGWCGSQAISVFIGQDTATHGTSGTRTVESADYTEVVEGVTTVNVAYAPRLYIEWDDSSINNASEGCFQNKIGATIANNADDAEDTPVRTAGDGSYLSGGLSNGTTDLDFAVEDLTGINPDITAVGLLFKNLNIPKDSTILEAYIELDPKENDTSSFSTTIGAIQDPTFTAWANEFTATSVGTTVGWNQSTDVDGDGTADGDWLVNNKVRTPDISAVLQQLVSLATWSNNGASNNLALKLTSSASTLRRIKSSDAGNPARLFVSYRGQYSTSLNTVRQEVVNAIDDYKLVSNQPSTETYLEGYQYYTGGLVNFGAYRGQPTRATNRVSHPDSYLNGEPDYGSNARENACLANYPEDNACKGETIVQSSNGAGAPAVTYIPPPMVQCQQNHIVLLSDGSPSPLDSGTRAATYSSINTLTGQTCTDNDGEDCSVELANYLANNDINNSVADDQIINTHAIHFGAINASKESFGKAVAAAGDGMYLQAADGPTLEAAFELLISSLAKVNTSFVSAGITVNQSNRLTHRDELYFSLFRPEPFASWPGNVKRYRIFGGEILDSNNVAAIVPGADIFKDTAQSFWSTSADGNDAGVGGAAGKLDFTVANRRVTFSNITGDTNITPSGDNMVNVGNTTPDVYSWETLLGTVDATASTAVLRWIMGYDVTGPDVTAMHNDIGDPLHSKPTILSYRQTIAGVEEEFDMVFVGTNHGFLHAFNTSDGSEQWSFIPRELLNNVRDYVINPAQDPAVHEYGVDGAITLYINDINGDGAVDVDDGERVFLYVGLRRGGNSYYAFDVTDFTSPRLMFKIDPTVAGFSDLGETWSRPVIAKLAKGNGTYTDADGVTRFELAMVFGGGYDTNQDPTLLLPSGGAPSVDTSGKNIYIANAITGAKIWDAQSNATQYTQAGTISLMNSVPGDIKAIDPRKPGYIEHIYASDTLGQVFRFDFDTDWNGSSVDELSQGGMLAQIQSSAGGAVCIADTCNRRFYYSPDIAIVPRPSGLTFVSVALGSGYRAHPLGTEIDDHFYGIRDMGVLQRETEIVSDATVETGFSVFNNHDGSVDGDGDATIFGAAASEVITLANLVNITSSPSGDTALNAVESTATPKAGWFLAMQDGEKVLAESITFNNRVIFTTFIPPDSTISVCAPQQGSGRVYAVNITDGTPAVDLNNDGNMSEDDRYIDLNNIGIPPEPQIIVLGNGPELLVGRQLATELLNADWGEMDRIKWRERNTR